MRSIHSCMVGTFRGHRLLYLSIVILIGILFDKHVRGAKVEPDFWDKYKALALDENEPKAMTKQSIVDDPSITRLGPNQISQKERQTPYPSSHEQKPPNFDPRRRFEDANKWNGENIDNKIFMYPRGETSKLTRLITEHNPTFVSSNVQKPLDVIYSGGKNGQVIAKYRFVVPIYVPAIKRKNVNQTRKQEEFVEEKVTEMVPIESSVPVVKEVIRAEEVPQKVVTNYVETPDDRVPANIEPKVLPGERVLKTTVQTI